MANMRFAKLVDCARQWSYHSEGVFQTRLCHLFNIIYISYSRVLVVPEPAPGRDIGHAQAWIQAGTKALRPIWLVSHIIDVTLACEDLCIIQTHKVIFAATSPLQ